MGVAIPADSDIREKQQEKNREVPGAEKNNLEQMSKVKSKVVPAVIGLLGAVTPQL